MGNPLCGAVVGTAGGVVMCPWHVPCVPGAGGVRNSADAGWPRYGQLAMKSAELNEVDLAVRTHVCALERKIYGECDNLVKILSSQGTGSGRAHSRSLS
ncbi:hypothetical protein GCM10010274_53740 [Streptomyces lavendofoliae]|uniref:Uncharacterized protein n=1 Tax=Streptomyces lavendofoliae TaxID=67314 RepID=A0A918I3H8_9ACTN|nr:hypothetical protein GCM10010274_53740 [Streptomyces lavendofoliae]